jgi:hypothetical protein
MLRKILMTTPALAFTLSFAAAQPATALPLTAPVQVSEWGDDDDDDNNGDKLIELQYCTEMQFEFGGDGRSYECAIDQGPSCLARCTAGAVAPLCADELGLAARDGACVADKIASCERQCEARGAAFCSPLQARGRDDDESEVFIEIWNCVDLEVDS